MTLKIEKQRSGDRVVVQLTGDLHVEHFAEVKAQIDVAAHRVVVDVAELALVGVDGIRFLNACEDNGVAVINASPYISEWMMQERTTSRTRT
jgi:hypothetical protein